MSVITFKANVNFLTNYFHELRRSVVIECAKYLQRQTDFTNEESDYAISYKYHILERVTAFERDCLSSLIIGQKETNAKYLFRNQCFIFLNGEDYSKHFSPEFQLKSFGHCLFISTKYVSKSEFLNK